MVDKLLREMEPRNQVIVELFCLVVFVITVGILALVLRDARGRFNLRLLLTLTSLIALGLWATVTFFRLVYGHR
jgi:hypothetical protein